MKNQSEITWAQFMLKHDGPVGMVVYERVMEIVKSNPEYFPWETLYTKIPEEVHKAFRVEAGEDWESILKRLPLFDENGDGVEAQISKTIIGKTPATIQDFKEMMEDLCKMEEDRRKREYVAEQNRRSIWAKHYSKYGLSYKK